MQVAEAVGMQVLEAYESDPFTRWAQMATDVVGSGRICIIRSEGYLAPTVGEAVMVLIPAAMLTKIDPSYSGLMGDPHAEAMLPSVAGRELAVPEAAPALAAA